MGIHVVKVPDIGEGIAEVELVEWHVRPGDTVVADQSLADVMTDKATVEVPSPVTGTVIARQRQRRGQARGGQRAAPARRRRRRTRRRRDGGRRRGPRDFALRTAAATAHGGTAPLPRPHRTRSRSPRRRCATTRGSWAWNSGAGPRDRARRTNRARRRRAARGGSHCVRPAVAQRYAERDGEHAVPVIGLRRQIAQHMQASLRIPHFTYVEEVDVTELEALRSKLNERFGATRGRLTLLPFLMRAIVARRSRVSADECALRRRARHRDSLRCRATSASRRRPTPG